jgi:uncharacterized protein YecT (DUF1311 family)
VTIRELYRKASWYAGSNDRDRPEAEVGQAVHRPPLRRAIRRFVVLRRFLATVNWSNDRMRSQIILFFGALLSWHSAFATDECAEASSHIDQRHCLEALAQKADTEVKNAQAQVIRRIDKWDEDENYKQGSRKLLQESLARFKAFKASQCELEASSAAGGNGTGDLRLDCHIRLDRQYAAELQHGWGAF